MVSNFVSIPGYQISEELYNGSRTMVYRAVRETDSLPVVIKLLKNPYPSFSELLSFRNQYTIAKNLKSPPIVQTYSLELYQNGYAVVMEDFGGISLKDYFASVDTRHIILLQEFLQIAIALCNALDILYRERIIHKDIKPSNILINPETKQVKLIDFSIASLLPRETQTLINPNVLEGTLAYISPEQTGRMNRGIDYRTDFYSLGITFYELLTGDLPFISNDPMELIHCHVAKVPLSLREVENQKSKIKSEEIPQVLSDIVMKLMAKNAEDRYQSILGLKYDLENCLTQFIEMGEIQHFAIAQRDVCDRFIIPDKLYGRETEVEILLQAFERVSQGATEMMLVAGFSGIGKTAVVNEVHKPIVRQRGYFIKGKFDQFNRNIPFSAFVQVFRDLMWQLLTESDAQIQYWKSKILEAVGENGQVIIEVIPELERIIGQQPPAPELSGTAAQNRFNLLFQKFIQVFTTAAHPVVIFLDDLQWADSASLKLMQLLMTDTGHLLLIGAYRDNEVNSAHPLILTLSEIEKAKVIINTIALAPLSQIKVNQLVADTLKCPENLAWNLSEKIFQKTQGNPFFATQFLKALHQDGLIQFNFDIGCWQCDIAQVTQHLGTDDVVAFMSSQLQKLPLSTQNTLQLAACIGNQFDLETLAIISQQSSIETATALWKALQEGLILPFSDVYKFYIGQENTEITRKNQQTVTYKFLHDRIQQAAYLLIPEDHKQATHLKIGQLLLNNVSQEKQEEKIFDIVNHLNMSIELITLQEKRNQLAQLNLIAGCKALASTAYIAAAKYFDHGINLLGVDSWQSQYQLTLSLYKAAVKAEYLNINFAYAQTLANFVLEHANSLLDRVKVYEVQIQMYMAQSEMPKALAVGILALELLEVDLNHAPISSAIELPKLAEIESLPMMLDVHQIAIMRILMAIFSPAYTTQPKLLSQIVLTMIDLSLKQGHTSLTAFAYVFYGILLCGFEKDLDKGYYSGLLALKVLEHFPARELECKVNNLFNVFIRPWKQPLIDTIEPLVRASQIGFEIGDIEYASYATTHSCTHRFIVGEPLAEVQKRQDAALEVLLKIKQDHSLHNAKIWQQLVSNLLGDVTDPQQLSGKNFDEIELLPVFCSGNDRSLPFAVYLAKCILSYLFEDDAAAVISAVNAANYADAAIGVTVGIHNFYYSLALLARCIDLLPSSVDDRHCQSLLNQVDVNQKFMQEWALHTPMNFEHKYILVEAEKYRVWGQKSEAIELYDKAIASAKTNKFIQDEALANELAAKFYLDWGKEKVAQAYMQEAYYCYARWGAKAKTDDLEKRYPELLQPILQQQQINFNTLETIAFRGTSSSTHASTTASTNISDVLDFTSILKAAQTISSSIELDQLITSLTQIILENSGAKKSILILPQEDIWQVRAITFINPQAQIQTILDPQALDTCEDIPRKIINYVKNTQETIVIDNCQTAISGVIGEYILEHRPKSVLCTPIINQGHLVAILYLENELTTGVFTNQRLQVINLLSSQVAISLENARLYQKSQQALQDLQQAQLKIIQSEKMSALGNLVAGVAHEMNNPLGFIYASLQQAKPSVADIVEHLKLYQANPPSTDEEIKDHAEEIELDYTLEDLPKMIDSMVMACDRLTNISTSLRTFSRADKDYKVPFNIHQGIDSTILILKHRLKANEQRPAIEVITNYGNLPQFECFPGQLNQVFMNLLANSIDALEELNKRRTFAEIRSYPNQIIITTSIVDNFVRIAIADNGMGMSESVKQKIFDHLFTTKAVSKGTGLGLAIARQIVEETHGGKLTCNSVLGKGTEFVIEIGI
ncbi:ATP-binding sensor histidine kinase [Anabaena cylindrica UHCC 0172]|uniref:ATP-binding sensor histidine kinase n=1 Tax=Anabaena cylindrica TaxID=1165 RepID=UPI002B1F456C|nr:ATP-binding sensor histidine kinase [Anabaena cylindrica]MEA5550763.1 ATP-binding sensor histidine kinase [Anabaena cylindrica UHCC 0172]